MKDYLYNKLKKNELTDMLSHNNSRNCISTSSIKASRSSFNVINDKINSSIKHSNTESSSSQLTQNQIMEPIRPIIASSKNKIIIKQSVWTFNIISTQLSQSTQQITELKEHIKFLLKQINKMKQIKELKGPFEKETMNKLIQEKEQFKKQIKDYKDKYNQLRINYEESVKQNKELNEELKLKRDFNTDINVAIGDRFEINLLKNFAKEIDITSTMNTTNNGESHNNFNHFNYSRNKTLENSLQPTCYIKKVRTNSKTKPINQFHTISHLPTPIIQKKLVLFTSINYLFYINQTDEKVIVFDITNNVFSLVNYTDTCDFNINNYNNDNLITLNVSDGLFILGGVDCDKLYFYSHSNNTISELQNLRYTHKKGAIVSYTNYLCEQRLIFLCSNTHTKVEMFYSDTKKWKELPEMNSSLTILSRIDSSYIVINKDFLFAFYGYDSIQSKYINEIDYLSLVNPSKWERIAIKIEVTGFNLRAHTMFSQKNNNETNTVYLLGGYSCKEVNSSLVTIDIKKDFSYFGLRINESVHPQLESSYDFTCSLYEYIDPNRIVYKYGFDVKCNVHIFNMETFKHKIVDYSKE